MRRLEANANDLEHTEKKNMKMKTVLENYANELHTKSAVILIRLKTPSK